MNYSRQEITHDGNCRRTSDEHDPKAMGFDGPEQNEQKPKGIRKYREDFIKLTIALLTLTRV